MEFFGSSSNKELEAADERLHRMAKDYLERLSKFWGLPNSLSLQNYLPEIKVCDNQRYREVVGSSNANIDREVPEMEFMIKGLGNLFTNIIVVNYSFYKKGFVTILSNVKSCLGEEVGHFIKENVNPSGDAFEDVAEFFGMLSKLFISEQEWNDFGQYYNSYLMNAPKYREYKPKIEEAMRKITQQKVRLKHEESMGVKPTESINHERAIIGEYERIAKVKMEAVYYLPAAAYYLNLRNMRSEDRYKILMRSSLDIRNNVIGRDAMRMIDNIEMRIRANSGGQAGTFREQEDNLKRNVEGEVADDEAKFQRQEDNLRREIDNEIGTDNSSFRAEEEELKREIGNEVNEDSKKFQEEEDELRKKIK